MVLLDHIQIQMVHEIQSAKAPMLAYRNVDHHAHEADFNDLNVSLVHKHDVPNLRELGGALLSKLFDQISQNLLGLVCLMEWLRLSFRWIVILSWRLMFVILLTVQRHITLHLVNNFLESNEKILKHFELVQWRHEHRFVF